MVGTVIRAVVPSVRVGEVCILRNPNDGAEVSADLPAQVPATVSHSVHHPEGASI